MWMPLIVFFSLYSTVVAAMPNTGLPLIKSVIQRYQSAGAVEIKLNKTVTLALLDETKKNSGRLFLSKGKLRLEIDKPEESLIIMGSNTLWVVVPSPAEFGGKTQVIKIDSKELSKQAKAPLAALLGKTSAWDQLKIINEIETSGIVKTNLVPKKPNLLGEIVGVTLEIDKKMRRLVALSYKDELDNETKYDFSETNFKAQVTNKMFQYVPPKNSDVTGH